MPKVFIVVLNWNGAADTIECVESLKKINYPDYKIVIVDNGSSDESIDKIPRKYFNEIFFIATKKNLGFAGGNNVGIKYALENNADFVLLLNNDTVVESDFLTNLVLVAQSDKKIGIVGPIIFSYDQPDTIWFAGGHVDRHKTKGLHLNFGQTLTLKQQTRVSPKIVDYITGCCLLIKKEVIEKIGLISDDYFLYHEDVDWCLRGKKAGFNSIFVPAARIYHKQSRSTGEFSYPYIYYHTRNGLILASKFNSKITTYFLSFWIFFKQIIKYIFGYKKDWAKAISRGVLDFWRGRKGKLEGYY